MRLITFAALAASTLAILAARPAAAQPALQELDKKLQEQLPPPPGGDLPERDAPRADAPFLGLFADEPEEGKGVLVRSVHPGGPADAAGLKRGDVISLIDGKAIRGLDDLAGALEAAAIGKKLRFEVTRDGKRSTHNVTLARRPAEPPRPPEADLPLDPAARPATPPEARERGSLGVSLTPLTEEARRRFGVTARSGALIAGIRQGSAADRFGLPLGGVIVSLDGRRIESPDDVLAALRSMRAGDEVELGYYVREKLARTRVRLAPAASAVPAELPAGPLDPGLADRPGLKKLDGFLDRLVPPAAAPPDLREPVGGRGEVAELRSEVELLRGEIDRLKRKLTELEERLERK